MRRKVLIVDDEADNRELLALVLANLKILSFEAESGPEALEKLRDVKVDLVLMDLQMPLMNGFEVIRNIRQNPKLKDLPIMLVSGSVDRPSLQKAIKLGITEILVKPLNVELLTHKINHFFQTPP